jgi:hypothetical protein
MESLGTFVQTLAANLRNGHLVTKPPQRSLMSWRAFFVTDSEELAMSEVERSEVEKARQVIAEDESRQRLITKVKEMIEAQLGMSVEEMPKISLVDWVPYAIKSPTGKVLFTFGIGFDRYGDLYLYLAKQGWHVWGGVYEWLEDICHEIKKLNRARRLQEAQQAI